MTRPRTIVCALLSGVFVASCGGGGGSPAGSSTSTPPVAAPSIQTQPVNQSVPMGLPATFSVTANGAALTYQWKLNGKAIPTAVNASFQTPATDLTYSGNIYTVTVSNSGGTVDSAPASLTVTARAPKAGDLRFQQVDAPSTVNGWGNAGTAISTFLVSRGGMYFAPAIGTPFYVGGNCGTPSPAGTGCDWPFSEFPQANTSGSAELVAAYASDFYDDFQADLRSPSWPAFSNGISPASVGAVITSADIETANDLFALSWVQPNTQSATSPVAFDLHMSTLALQDLQAAATQEGLNSRVITAVTANGAQVTYFSYGWQGDTTTLYDSQIVTATPAAAATAAANLAAAGYIITATGSADSSGTVLLVGTRVQGDSMPRPFVITTDGLSTLTYAQQGYALVGIASGNLLER